MKSVGNWRDIKSAPKKVGTRISVKREVDGVLYYEGVAVWRTHTFKDDHVFTGWMHPTKNHKIPVPTHWRLSGMATSK